MKSITKKLFITGGHLTPALASIEEIADRKLPCEIVFLGRRVAFEGTNSHTREEDIIRSMGIRFLPMTTGRLQRAFSVYSLVSLAKIPVGLMQAFYFCLTQRPVGILSFGGYVALPVVAAAALLGIPVVTHEQTSVVGLANRIIAVFAKKICVTFEETKEKFPREKVVVTGLPVRKELFRRLEEEPFAVNSKTFPVIYITGGSMGSVSLNALVFPLISRLTKRFTVIHQTGRESREKAIQIKEHLPKTSSSRYIVQDYFDIRQVGWIFREAALLVGRSGANTVMEAAMFGKMALYIPLPWSGGGEQLKNARFLESAGSSRVIEQDRATPEGVLQMIELMIAKKTEYTKNAQNLSSRIPRDAARRLVDELVNCFSL